MAGRTIKDRNLPLEENILVTNQGEDHLGHEDSPIWEDPKIPLSSSNLDSARIAQSST